MLFVQCLVLLCITVCSGFAAAAPQRVLQEQLFHCIRKVPKRAKIQEILRHDGWLLHQCEMNGKTPLLVAACENRREIVKDFLRLGANANHTDIFGMTALMHAIQQQHADVVKVLLAWDDIDLFKVSLAGETAFSLAKTSKFSIRKMIDDVQIKLAHEDSAVSGSSKTGVEQELMVTDIVREQVNGVEMGGGAEPTPAAAVAEVIQHGDLDDDGFCRACAQLIAPEEVEVLKSMLILHYGKIVWDRRCCIDL